MDQDQLGFKGEDCMSRQPKRVAVIGAGPAGLAAAGAVTGGEVVLYDKNTQAGVKLLVSGLGQCNIASAGPLDECLRHYPLFAREWIAPALKEFGLARLLHWFEERGVRFEVRHAGETKPLASQDAESAKGKIFPAAGGAAIIRDTLLREVLKSGGRFSGESSVSKIEKTKAGFNVFRQNTQAVEQYQAVILSCGGMSWPQTGSNGDGYRLAKALGHTIITPVPALTSIICPDEEIAGLAGVAVQSVRVRIVRKGVPLDESKSGDLLFTHRGLSGPAILDASYLMRSADTVSLQLLDQQTVEGLLATFRRLAESAGSTRMSRILELTGLPRAVQDVLARRAGLEREDRLASIGKKRIAQFGRLLIDLCFSVKGLTGMEQAMCTAGGISLDEVDCMTMQSKKVSGLFFCGEVLDLNGDCGGYNIRAALASGRLAGRNVFQ